MKPTNTYKDVMERMKTCIVGIGNSLRADDGAGAFVCREIESKNLPAVHIIITQQLDFSMASDLSGFDQVIFVDASRQQVMPSIQLVDATSPSHQSSSHQVDAATLVSLVKRLYSSHTRFYICAITAYDFTMGEGLSASTMQHATEAVSLITSWIEKNR